MNRYSILAIIGCCVVALIAALPSFLPGKQFPDFFPKKTISLGLDLQGGAHLLLRVDTASITNKAKQDAKASAERVLRKAGLQTVAITPNTAGFTVQLADAANLDAARKALRKDLSYRGIYKAESDHLDFAIAEEELVTLRNNAMERALQVIRTRVDETGTKEPTIQRQGQQHILVQLPGVDDPARIVDLIGETGQLSFHLVDETVGNKGYVTSQAAKVPFRSIVLPSTDRGEEGLFIAVNSVPILSGETLVDASQGFDQNSRPAVNFRFNAEGGTKFARVTAENVQKKFAVVLDGKIITAPVIQGAIPGGNGQITGNFDVQSAQDLALLLRSGALPAPIKVVEERTVGPSLGQDSIEAGRAASAIGLAAVIVLIAIVYGRFGVYATIALVVNIVLIVAVLATLQATLTLPGIAGIVLTIGMAVDANVLIFERIREEAYLGKAPNIAVRDGYQRALGTILDANITTLIAALILFSVGTGPIKGFAVTLGVGIFTSLFSAIMVTRLLVYVYLRKRPSRLPLTAKTV